MISFRSSSLFTLGTNQEENLDVLRININPSTYDTLLAVTPASPSVKSRRNQTLTHSGANVSDRQYVTNLPPDVTANHVKKSY